MIFNIFIILCGFILITGSFYLLLRWSKPKKTEDTPTDGYLKARKIFVRDPQAFKDKDEDGIDDIIDDNIK